MILFTHKMKRVLLSAMITLCILPTFGQEEKQWSLQAGFGGIQMLENRYEGGDKYESEDEGNAYYVSADYWLSQRLALSGGLVFEQQGLYTSKSNGIGSKKVNMLGISAGAKYYFFPKKWIFQPHIGASIYTNCLNLGHQIGKSTILVEQGYPGSHGLLSYDVSCPALSLSPNIGIDVHLFSSVSLCVDYDLRFGLWGSNKAQLYFTDGPMTGKMIGIDERNHRRCISLGLKIDFPVKPVSEKAQNNLMWIIYSLISSKAS